MLTQLVLQIVLVVLPNLLGMVAEEYEGRISQRQLRNVFDFDEITAVGRRRESVNSCLHVLI